MSAIAGIFNVDERPAERASLRAMADAVRDRGPDGAWYWTEGAAGLAFRKLATTPEAMHEEQPWVNADATIRVIFDGRIDNRRELAQELESSGVTLDEPTDVELVGRCFELWNEETWNRLLGDFAIVVWDSRRRKMLCARDPLGFKPLHYYFNGKKFLCASELIQILRDSEVERSPNEAFLGEFLAGGPYTRKETAICGVFRLEGGCCLAVDSGGIRKRRYFDPGSVKQIRLSSYNDCADALRELLVEAVRCRMRAPGDVASQLSGGLDSSSIVSIGCDLSRRGVVSNRIEAFSLVFSDPRADEREYIEEVERAWSFSTHRCEPFEPEIDYFADRVRQTFELPRLPNAVMMEDLERAVGRMGLRVCLNGHGGDHVMDGNSSDLAALVRGFHPIRFWRALRLLRRNQAAGEVTQGIIHILLRSGIWPLAPIQLRKLVRGALRRDYIRTDAWQGWLDPNFTRRIALKDRVMAARNEVKRETPAVQSIYNLLRDGWTAYVMEGLERTAVRLGFDYRYPFCDRRVIEFVLGLAEEYRWNQGRPRLLMRQAMRPLLPQRIVTRPSKALFDDVFMRVTKNVEHRLAQVPGHAEVEWVSAKRFSEACDSAWRLYEARDARYAHYMWAIFALFGLEIWMTALRGPNADLSMRSRTD